MNEHGEPLSTIVVEDDDVLREALVDWLDAAGVEVVAEASTAAEAIQACKVAGAGTMLLDFRLKGSTGLEVARAIRDAKLPVRVVMFTAYGDDSLERSATEAGVAAFIVKGTDPARVMDALRGPPPTQ